MGRRGLPHPIEVDLGCYALVGDSMDVNVALEMATSDAFSGLPVLLAPSRRRLPTSSSRRSGKLATRVRGPIVGLVMSRAGASK